MSSLSLINPKADLVRAQHALQINASAARGLEEVLAPNFGPRGTMKMLVSGGGDVQITKDGSVLLSEMQIQHPTAALISKVTASQDEITGDGTTSTVLIVGEMLRIAEQYSCEGLHPRFLAKGFGMAKDHCYKILEKYATKVSNDRDVLCNAARSSLCTKLSKDMIPIIVDAVVDAVLSIKPESGDIDLYMVEIMEMCHNSVTNTRLIKGLVLDHGGRNPLMPKIVNNAFILTCNVSLEYEKTEINSSACYKSYEEREQLVSGERRFIDERVSKIISFKKLVCPDSSTGFVIFNQKGIDPISLESLASAGILALRRTKRRNMERIVAACGGIAVNSVDELSFDVLGKAGVVREYSINDEKYTFVENVPKSGSVTILINGRFKHELSQVKNAIRDGLRAVNNVIRDSVVLPGAGAIEIVLREELLNYSKTIEGKEKVGVIAFADALLVIPRVLAKNAGLDPVDAIIKLSARYNSTHNPIGLDLSTGEAIDSISFGIFDNFCVKKQILSGCTSLATNLLLVDEIIRAGVSTRPQALQ